MESNLHLIEDEIPEKGIAVPAIASLIFHGLLLLIAWMKYSHVPPPVSKPVVNVVQLVARTPTISSYFEAPGAALPKPPSKSAPLSNANRRASAPNATGDARTAMPGSGGVFTPGGIGGARQVPTAPPPRQQSSQPPTKPAMASASTAMMASVLPVPATREASDSSAKDLKGAAEGVDWQSAIREAGKMTSRGDGRNMAISGGERGFADAGPISFESQWFEWGDYADSMVRKIRLHWNENMPPLLRMGVKGVVTIRFTILRNGQIRDITILESSETPPYDFAAKKAIELSSALAPLPENFPNAQERVTAQFFYNLTPPSRSSR